MVTPFPKTVYLGLGSNIFPQLNLEAAISGLEGFGDVRKVSTIYRTQPVGGVDQPEYLNGVILYQTHSSPEQLKNTIIRDIEGGQGRERSDDPNAPRQIDIDILLYEERIIDEDGIKIPDPDIWSRPFVAIPLLEVAGDITLPGTGERLADLSILKEDHGMIEEPEITQRLREAIT